MNSFTIRQVIFPFNISDCQIIPCWWNLLWML